MPKISITSLNKELFCPPKNQSILKDIQDHSIDWMHACGAKGRCTTCCMIVLEGMENISKPAKSELSYRERSMLKPDERLACQSSLLGDIKIRIPGSNRMPHMDYLD